MTFDDYGQYFFTLIQRAPGHPADDYDAVLGASTIPAGLPPFVVPDVSMPHHALTQQIGSDGRIAGRLFLPTAAPDDLGYYSHPVSPLRDGPTPGTLVWEWRDLGGPPIVMPEDATVPVPPSGGLTEAEVNALIDDALVPVYAQLAALETAAAQPVRAHGPVNLPIVLESLTSLRAKGDIDVAVTPGEATPPPDTSGDGPSDAATLVLLKKLLARRDQPEG
jgi:hypothetical protein